MTFQEMQRHGATLTLPRATAWRILRNEQLKDLHPQSVITLAGGYVRALLSPVENERIARLMLGRH